MKKLMVVALIGLIWFFGHGWGGRNYVGGGNLDNRVAILPFTVYSRVVPGFNDSWSVHYEFNCWMLPGERYTVLSDVIEGVRYVESGRCDGNAKIR